MSSDLIRNFTFEIVYIILDHMGQSKAIGGTPQAIASVITKLQNSSCIWN